MEKEQRIKKELRRLNKLFVNLEENQKQTAAGLIRSAAFMAVSLEDLEEIINEQGYIDQYQNGANQNGEKISAAVQTYNNMVARYTTIIDKLLKIVPRAEKKEKNIIHAPRETERERAEREKRQEEKERTALFFEALKDGRITQDDYTAFMAGEID